VIEESRGRTDLYAAEEILMTGPAAEVVPVRSVDGHVIGDAGPVTLELQKAYFEVVRGQNGDYKEWLEYL